MTASAILCFRHRPSRLGMPAAYFKAARWTLSAHHIVIWLLANTYQPLSTRQAPERLDMAVGALLTGTSTGPALWAKLGPDVRITAPTPNMHAPTTTAHAMLMLTRLTACACSAQRSQASLHPACSDASPTASEMMYSTNLVALDVHTTIVAGTLVPSVKSLLLLHRQQRACLGESMGSKDMGGREPARALHAGLVQGTAPGSRCCAPPKSEWTMCRRKPPCSPRTVVRSQVWG